jgi:hypothetical protein
MDQPRTGPRSCRERLSFAVGQRDGQVGVGINDVMLRMTQRQGGLSAGECRRRTSVQAAPDMVLAFFFGIGDDTH